MKIYRVIATAIMEAGLLSGLLVLPLVSHPKEENHFPNKVIPRMSRLVNCDEWEIQPCWMERNGVFLILRSYGPYNAYEVEICKAEDGGPILPCLWQKDNADKDGGISTRNFFWRNDI